MQEQFLQVAETLSWDLETQIDRLDEFVRVYGAAGRMDAELSEIGLSVSQSFHREALCTAMLNFIERLGAAGAFSHFLHRQLQRAREANAPRPSEPARTPTDTRQAPERLAAISPVPQGSAGRLGKLMRRWLGREARAGRQVVAS